MQRHITLSGATTTQLRSEVKLHTHSLAANVILLMGVNDLLQGIECETTLDNFKFIINYIIHSGRTLFICTLPKLVKHKHLNSRIKSLNFRIKSFNTKSSVYIINLQCIFKNQTFEHLIEKFYYNGKVDGIHLNQTAHNLILKHLVIVYEKLNRRT